MELDLADGNGDWRKEEWGQGGLEQHDFSFLHKDVSYIRCSQDEEESALRLNEKV